MRLLWLILRAIDVMPMDLDMPKEPYGDPWEKGQFLGMASPSSL